MSRFPKLGGNDLPEAERPAFQPPAVKPEDALQAAVSSGDGQIAKPAEPDSAPKPEIASEAARTAALSPDLGARFTGAQADKSVVQTSSSNARAEKLVAFYEAFSELDVKTIRHISQSIGKMGNKRLCAWSKVLVAHDEAFGVIDKI